MKDSKIRTITRKGIFIGAQDQYGNEVYKGIPYCLPPTGERRWLPPQEIPDNFDTREALEFSPIPPQADAGKYAGMPQSEDCLYLNIWKSNNGSDKKAVLVWNYGGSFIKGGTRNPDFDGGLLVSQYPDIIFVSVNHRLGLLANLNLSTLDPENKYYASNNLAQLDLNAALKWVYENIAFFGGDQDRITVYGHSSGSSNISAQFLLATPTKYFKRAIMHSSFAIDVGTTSLERSRMVANKLFEILGNPTLEDLLAMSVEDLMAAQRELLTSKFPSDVKPFSVVEDGTIIPVGAYQNLLKGSCKGYACIIGSACGEYDQQFRGRTEQDQKAFLLSQIGGRTDSEALIDAYCSHDPERDIKTTYMDIKNDLWIRVPGNLMASALSAENKVYMFYTATVDEENHIRAPHGNEYLAEFGHPNYGLYSEETVQSMRNMLANFVISGIPACDNAENMTAMPEWPCYDAEERKTLALSDHPYISNGIRVQDMETLLPLYREINPAL